MAFLGLQVGQVALFLFGGALVVGLVSVAVAVVDALVVGVLGVVGGLAVVNAAAVVLVGVLGSVVVGCVAGLVGFLAGLGGVISGFLSAAFVVAGSGMSGAMVSSG